MTSKYYHYELVSAMRSIGQLTMALHSGTYDAVFLNYVPRVIFSGAH